MAELLSGSHADSSLDLDTGIARICFVSCMTERLPCCLEWVVATAPRCRVRFRLLFFLTILAFFCVYLLVTSCVTISAYSALFSCDSRGCGGIGRVGRGSIHPPSLLFLSFVPSLGAVTRSNNNSWPRGVFHLYLFLLRASYVHYQGVCYARVRISWWCL